MAKRLLERALATLETIALMEGWAHDLSLMEEIRKHLEEDDD